MLSLYRTWWCCWIWSELVKRGSETGFRRQPISTADWLRLVSCRSTYYSRSSLSSSLPVSERLRGTGLGEELECIQNVSRDKSEWSSGPNSCTFVISGSRQKRWSETAFQCPSTHRASWGLRKLRNKTFNWGRDCIHLQGTCSGHSCNCFGCWNTSEIKMNIFSYITWQLQHAAKVTIHNLELCEWASFNVIIARVFLMMILY